MHISKFLNGRWSAGFLIATALLFSSLALAETGSSAQTKIATVDVNKIINSSPDAAAKKKQLDEKTMAAKKKVDDRRASLKSIDEKLKSQGVAEDSKEAEDFRAKARDYTRLVKDTEESLKKEYLRTNKELTEKAIKSIRQYAEKNGIDLVLDKGDQVRGPVLFGRPAADITENVIKSLNS